VKTYEVWFIQRVDEDSDEEEVIEETIELRDEDASVQWAVDSSSFNRHQGFTDTLRVTTPEGEEYHWEDCEWVNEEPRRLKAQY